MVRRSLYKAFVLAAGRSAVGSLHFSPSVLERLAALPAHRSQRAASLGAGRTAPAAQTGGPPQRHIGPAPCRAVPRGTVRTPCRLQWVDVCRSACTRARSAAPVAPPAPVARKLAAPFRVSAAVKNASRLGLRAPCALGLAPLFAAVPAQGPIGRGPRLPAPRTHAASEALGGNAFIPPTPACTFFLGIFIWHIPSFRGCSPGEGRPAGEALPTSSATAGHRYLPFTNKAVARSPQY